MVVFTCSQCGQSVKKNQVENHCNYQCRSCQSLSCMDCGKLFWGDDYKGHIKCITEDQKYGGKGYQPKPSSNKGEVKQEKWIEHIKNIIHANKLSDPLKNYLEQIVQFSNIPRKKSKFENFLKNSLKLRNQKIINEAWEIFSQSTSNESKSDVPQSHEKGLANDNSKSPHLNGNDAPHLPEKRHVDDSEGIPNKRLCLNGTVSKTPVKNPEDFKWVEVIEKILLQYAQNSLPIRSLRKQVLSEYKATVTNSALSKNDLKKKFKEVVSSCEIFVFNKMKE